MSVHIHQTLELVVAQIRQLEEQAAQKKQLANNLCDLAGAAYLYPEQQANAAVLLPLAPDSYCGRALAPVVREVLERRKRAGLGAATASEIYDLMKDGGYLLTTKNGENAMQALYIMLTNNTSTFYRFPNGTYGLLGSDSVTKPVRPATVRDKPSDRDDEDREDEDEPVVEVAESLAGSVCVRDIRPRNVL